jgi:glycosidase
VTRLKQTTGSDAAVLEIARKEYQLKSRDHARTPVQVSTNALQDREPRLTRCQWDSSTNAGFSTATPWIRVNDDYKEWNAAAQVAKPDSVFEHWKSALALRKELKNIIVYGDFELLDEDNDDVFAYARSNGTQKVVIVCNFREREISWSPPVDLQSVKVLLSNYPEVNMSQKTVNLRPFEAFVCQLH